MANLEQLERGDKAEPFAGEWVEIGVFDRPDGAWK